MPFSEYFAHVWQGTTATLHGSAGAGAEGTLGDLLALMRELQTPTRVAPETLAEATAVQFPGLDGVLPGFGRQQPNDWGLGLEVRDGKSPHWTGVAECPADVRPLRAQRDVRLGRPRGRDRTRLSHRPCVRRLGGGGMAAASDAVLAEVR